MIITMKDDYETLGDATMHGGTALEFTLKNNHGSSGPVTGSLSCSVVSGAGSEPFATQLEVRLAFESSTTIIFAVDASGENLLPSTHILEAFLAVLPRIKSLVS